MMAHTRAKTLLSSVHGRDRRSLRKIGKRDLQSAVKYGMRERGYPRHSTGEPTWKYTFRHVVYITDDSSRSEITSYVLPINIPTVSLSLQERQMHQKVAGLLTLNPHVCTTHTVLVVDQSGSMKKCDVVDFKNRSQAVYGTIALDLLGKRLDQGTVALACQIVCCTHLTLF
jgi:hypothetical protein